MTLLCFIRLIYGEGSYMFFENKKEGIMIREDRISVLFFISSQQHFIASITVMQVNQTEKTQKKDYQ